jgi:hypothetical protein
LPCWVLLLVHYICLCTLIFMGQVWRVWKEIWCVCISCHAFFGPLLTLMTEPSPSWFCWTFAWNREFKI